MVPLEKVLDGPGSTRALVLAPTKRRPSEPPEPSPPWRFKVVDVMTRSVLAEDADARATVDLLKGIRSIVDVSVYAWDATAARWRALTLGERQTLWGFRDRRPS